MADPPITVAHLFILVLVSLTAVLWGATFVVGAKGIQFEQYLLLLGFLGLTSAIFIFTRIKGNHLGIFHFPVFLTLLVFVRFGLAPVASFLDPADLDRNFDGHYAFLLRALAYVVIGMLAFWTGCHLVSRKAWSHRPASVLRLSRQTQAGHSSLVWAGVIYAVVFVARLYLLHAHLYLYTASWKAYYAHLSSLQVLEAISTLGGVSGLILVTIEKYFHPSALPCRLFFWGIFASECVWGLASGMKGHALQPFITVAIVSSLIERRFKKGWVAFALLGLIVLYPFSNNYRRLVQHKGGLTSPTGVASASLKALSVTEHDEDGTSGWVQNGWLMSVRRADMLTSFGLVLWLGPKTVLLRGKERWWMVPYYPFIPRFIWHSKPILDKGRRFSVATGSTITSSMAITYPGDLYATYGLPGIVLGMFLLGIVTQGLTNTITGIVDKRHLFVYAAMFIPTIHLETDTFSYMTSLIKSFVILSVISLVIFGPDRRAVRGLAVRKKAAAQPCRS
jgi:hypothetical protein